MSLLIERKLILNKDLVIYLLGGALVMLINYLVVRFIVKTEKQAIIFVIVKAVLVAGAAIYALGFCSPFGKPFKMLSGFILAMLCPVRARNRKNSW